MACQCKFISYNNCPTLVSDVDNGEGCACVGVRDIWELPVPSSQFDCKNILSSRAVQKPTVDQSWPIDNSLPNTALGNTDPWVLC